MKVCNLFVLKEKHGLCSLSIATPLCKPFVCEREFVKVMKDIKFQVWEGLMYISCEQPLYNIIPEYQHLALNFR